MNEVSRRFRALPAISLLYFGLLAVLLIILHWWAEYFLPVWVLLFVPPIFLLAPAFALGSYAFVKKERAWAIAHAACAVLFLFVFCRYRLSGSAGTAAGFTVVTHNIGQGNKIAFADAFPGESPDAVLLQDAKFRERDYARRFPQFHARGVAQFLLLTKHGIVDAAPVADALWRRQPVAARFVIRMNGRDVALYNVHLPTPRSSLRHFLSPRVALEVLWLADAPTDDQPSYRSWLRARVHLAEQLATVFSREKLPFVVAGDFNTPDHGLVYRRISANLQDAHAVAGNGWGYTFPADARKDGLFARVFGPWLRLDYVFAGNGFSPVECRVAYDQRSQHRAVLARLAPVP